MSLLFLVYINDIVNEIESDIGLYAEDTNLHIAVDFPDTTANILQRHINKISDSASKWLVTFNSTKSRTMVI